MLRFILHACAIIGAICTSISTDAGSDAIGRRLRWSPCDDTSTDAGSDGMLAQTSAVAAVPVLTDTLSVPFWQLVVGCQHPPTEQMSVLTDTLSVPLLL